MIGFIAASSQLESIITAHTLNSFWTTSVWPISMKNLGLISCYFEYTNHLPFLSLPRGPIICHNVEQLVVLCCSVCCHGSLVFSNSLPGNDAAFSPHVTMCIYIYISHVSTIGRQYFKRASNSPINRLTLICMHVHRRPYLLLWKWKQHVPPKHSKHLPDYSASHSEARYLPRIHVS
jgi:hypothetical protein